MGINQGPISLDQKYTQSSGHVFMTGIQALVRLPMAQIRRDRAAGLNTAGFISGYRGSPLGGYDQQLFAARKHLDQIAQVLEKPVDPAYGERGFYSIRSRQCRRNAVRSNALSGASRANACARSRRMHPRRRMLN